MSPEIPASFILPGHDTAFRLAKTRSLYRPFGAFGYFSRRLSCCSITWRWRRIGRRIGQT
jgi:hypothetical protein